MIPYPPLIPYGWYRIVGTVETRETPTTPDVGPRVGVATQAGSAARLLARVVVSSFRRIQDVARILAGKMQGQRPAAVHCAGRAAAAVMTADGETVGTHAAVVWDDNFDPVANAVDVLVDRLRRRIQPEGQVPLIHTVRSRGYILSEVEPADVP